MLRLVIACLAMTWASVAHAQVPTPVKPVPYAALIGTQVITVSGSAQGLTVPAGASVASLSVTVGNVNYRDDGTAPTASVGLLLVSGGGPYTYSGPLSAIQFILPSGVVAATVTAAYYR